MANLEQSVCNIVDIYLRYSKDGKMSKGEMKKLVKEQCPKFKDKLCAEACEQAKGCAEKGDDCEVSCEDFKKLVCHLMKCCYEQKMPGSQCQGCDK